VRGARANARPLEVVILMDVLEVANMPSSDITERIKAAALAVLQSLTTRDKVGMWVDQGGGRTRYKHVFHSLLLIFMFIICLVLVCTCSP